MTATRAVSASRSRSVSLARTPGAATTSSCPGAIVHWSGFAFGGLFAGGARAKTAVTARSAVMATVQAPVPEQAPLQWSNTDPGAAVAVRATLVAASYCAVHVLPQLIPLPVTAPVPVPERETVSVERPFAANTAVTDRSELMVRVHDP